MPWSTCAASSRPTWRSGSKPTTAELLVQLVLHGIDHVADLVLDLAGRLVDLALVLEVLVVGEVACGFLHPALHVIHVAHVALLIGDLCCLPDAWSGEPSGAETFDTPTAGRSEEHTSELQSLMRL